MLNAALYERTQILVGDEGIRRLHAINVIVVGTGGVGGHCAEALVRAGVGRITICDHDVASSTNKNRQLIALDSTIGKSKVHELGKRLKDISAHCGVTCMDAFLLPEDMEEVLTDQPFTHVIDCVDSVDCKVALLGTAVKLGLKVYSAMGAGGRLDPTKVQIGDLFDTENDALSRLCRTEMRKRDIGPGAIIVVHSTEKGLPPMAPQRMESGGRNRAVNGTISYMPPLYGLLLSSVVLREALDPAGTLKARKKVMKEGLKREASKAKFLLPAKAEREKMKSGDKAEREKKAGVKTERREDNTNGGTDPLSAPPTVPTPDATANPTSILAEEPDRPQDTRPARRTEPSPTQ